MANSTVAEEGASRWVTLANGLTGLRLVGAPLCAAAILFQAHLLAAGIFALAVVTDLADGRIARRRGEASPLGGRLDHASDATFVTLGLGALAYRGAVPALLPAVVVAAFLQYAFDSRREGGSALRPSRIGRWNGIAYFALLGVPVIRDALGLGWPGAGWVQGAGWLLVASSLFSMAARARTSLASSGSAG
jgi:phosphatidylglycerophosphate synthase